MQLPPALQPWASLLAPFPDDLALTLGQLVRRLSLAIGDGHRSRPGDDGEPDGVGGISRHGPYDRLLLTEWALADELPDEFARRAASGEHAFLELARQRPAASSRTFVLIDTGPDQLGTPRLAHLALLILLARRAEARRGTLRWASLQATSFNSFDVSRSGIEALLATRTCAAPTSAALDDWLVHLDSDGHQNNYDGATEIWVIGGRRIELDGDRRVTRVTVEDVIEPGVRRLELELRRSGGIARNILLDLPDDVRTTRLVRDPFARDPFVGGPFVIRRDAVVATITTVEEPS